MIGDGYTADFFHDSWIFDLPLSRWPIFVSSKIGDSMGVSNLIHSGRYGWHDECLVQAFGPDLASRVMSIVIPTYDA